MLSVQLAKIRYEMSNSRPGGKNIRLPGMFQETWTDFGVEFNTVKDSMAFGITASAQQRGSKFERTKMDA